MLVDIFIGSVVIVAAMATLAWLFRTAEKNTHLQEEEKKEKAWVKTGIKKNGEVAWSRAYVRTIGAPSLPPPPPPKPTTTSYPGRLTNAEKTAGLARMNELRRNLTTLPDSDPLPAASQPLVELKWDDELERQAQEWADGCPEGHRPQNKNGENMAWATSRTTDLVTAVDMFDSERRFVQKSELKNGFVFDTGRNAKWCKNGDWSACGHLTQQLWNSTTRVGCARSSTPCKLGGRDATLIVCNYAPAGNFQGRPVYPTRSS